MKMVLEIIGCIITILSIIVTCISIKKAKSQTNGRFINQIEKKTKGKTTDIIYIHNNGTTFISPVIKLTDANPQFVNITNDISNEAKIKKALKRENSIQVLMLKKDECRFRVTASNGEVLYHSDNYISIDECQKAIDMFLENYI